MSGITVDLDGLGAVLARIAATDQQIERASRRAITKATRYAAREIARGIAAEEQIPLRSIYRARGRTKGQRVFSSLPKNDKTSGRVWVGHNPIEAAYLGNLRQTKRGAYAGRHFFERAFVATMPSGHTSVYRRKGASRLPISAQDKAMTSAPLVAARVERLIPQRLEQLLQQELNYEVNVRGNR